MKNYIVFLDKVYSRYIDHNFYLKEICIEQKNFNRLLQKKLNYFISFDLIKFKLK